MNIQALRDGLAYVEAELRSIHEAADDQPLAADVQARWDEGTAYVADTRAQIATFEARQAIVDGLEDGTRSAQPGVAYTAPGQIRKRDTVESVLEDRAASSGQITDAITRQIESYDIDPTNARMLLKRHRKDTNWSRGLLARSTDVYADAFDKFLTGREMLLTSEERAALAVGTNTQGGFLVPTHLDPSIILTNDGTANALRPISRVVTLTTGNTWNGVSSAGVTASWDAELAEVSDDSPSVANPSIPVYKGAAFVQASFEAFQDISSLASDVMMMFGDAKDRLEGAAHCTGSGSAEPTGIFTAIDASGNETVTTTAATIGLVDLQAQRRAVGQRFRNRSTWVTHPEWMDEVKRLGTAVSASFTTDLTASNSEQLLGRPVVETDDAPNTATTTALDDRFVLGDFSNFVIVDMPGSVSVSFIPHMFDTTTNLPNGVAGWYMYWRGGSDSVNDAAFQLLMDRTSA